MSSLVSWLESLDKRKVALKVLVKQGYTTEQAEDVYERQKLEERLVRRHLAQRKKGS